MRALNHEHGPTARNPIQSSRAAMSAVVQTRLVIPAAIAGVVVLRPPLSWVSVVTPSEQKRPGWKRTAGSFFQLWLCDQQHGASEFSFHRLDKRPDSAPSLRPQIPAWFGCALAHCGARRGWCRRCREGCRNAPKTLSASVWGQSAVSPQQNLRHLEAAVATNAVTRSFSAQPTQLCGPNAQVTVRGQAVQARLAATGGFAQVGPGSSQLLLK
jgi:hypothetical protein